MSDSTTINSVSSSSKRFWRQFTLRALFLAVGIVAIFCAWVTYRVRILRAQASFVEDMRAKGFRVYVDAPTCAWFWRALVGDSVGTVQRANLNAGDQDGNWIGPTAEEVRGISRYSSLTALSVFGQGVNDETLKQMCNLPNLEFLQLTNPDVSDSVIELAKSKLGKEFHLTVVQVVRYPSRTHVPFGKRTANRIE
jgi:hypothetical protein